MIETEKIEIEFINEKTVFARPGQTILEAATKQLNNSLLVSESAYKILPESRQDLVSVEIELKGVRDPCRVYLLGKPYE